MWKGGDSLSIETATRHLRIHRENGCQEELSEQQTKRLVRIGEKQEGHKKFVTDGRPGQKFHGEASL
jgi:hypothetical protein